MGRMAQGIKVASLTALTRSPELVYTSWMPWCAYVTPRGDAETESPCMAGTTKKDPASTRWKEEKQLLEVWGWKDNRVAGKRTYCLPRGHRLGSQHPLQVSHNRMKTSGLGNLTSSYSLPRYLHAYTWTSTYTHNCILKTNP